MCSQCHVEKPIEAFHKDISQSSGYRSACQVCLKEKRKKPPLKVKQLTLCFTKTCRVCGIEKDTDYFEPYSFVCKSCRMVRKKDQARKSQQLADEENTLKICTKCHQEKPLSEFHRQITNQKGYAPRCKACDNPRRRHHYQENIEYYHRLRKERYDPVVKHEHNQRYYQENSERMREYGHAYYEATKEIGRAQRKAWQQANLLKCRQSNDKRRAIKRNATIGTVNYDNILERDGYWCYICEGTVSPEQLSFDHEIPLERGGAHSEENIRISHKICNSRKHIRLLSEMTPFQRRGV